MNRGYPGRLGLVAVLAAILPACGRTAQTPMAGPLFQEAFGGPFPGTAWSSPALSGSASATVDLAAGMPAPSLLLGASDPGSSVSTTSTASFVTPSLTISLDVADVSSSPSQSGSASVAILDPLRSTLGSATWDNATRVFTFHIAGAADVQSASLPADASFHHLVFSVNGFGLATWSLDGATAPISNTIPSGMVSLELGAAFGAGSAWPGFHFDNVTVTSP